MFEAIRRFFTGNPPSARTAKERLQLVLMTDHLALGPEIVEAMKRDLVDVISRHVEVDRERIDVRFERQDRALAMLANIPILSVNRPAPAAGTVPPTRPRRKRTRRKGSAQAAPRAQAQAQPSA